MLTALDDLPSPDLHNENDRERDKDDSRYNKYQHKDQWTQRDVPHSCNQPKSKYSE